MKAIFLVVALISVLKGYSQDADSFFTIASVRSQQGDYAGAIDYYSRSIKVHPGNRETYMNRALAKGQLKDYIGAIADYTAAISVNPDWAMDAYYNRAAMKSMMKDSQGAIEDFKQVLAINPNYAFGYVGLGGELYAQKDYKGAIAQLAKAIELDQYNGPAYFIRGKVKLAQGQKDDACADFGKALLAGYAPAGPVINETCK